MSKSQVCPTIVFLSEGNSQQASAAHRIYPLAEFLQSRNVHTHVISGTRRAIGRSRIWIVGFSALMKTYFLLGKNDVLVIHRTAHFGVFLLTQLARWTKNTKVIFDFDDAVHLEWRFGLKNPLYGAINPIIQACDVTWCGSHELMLFAKKHGRCTHIPTAVGSEFVSNTATGTTPPTILWIGNGPGHYDNLALMISPLEKLAKVVDFRLHLASALGSEQIRKLFGHLEEKIEIDYGWESWISLSRVVDHVKYADIGIMPLIDTPWNRGKCSIKALEAMAMGLPTVMSDVGENRYVANNEKSALLANDCQQWYRHLRLLISSPKMRSRYGKSGRALVKERYTPSVVFQKAVDSLSEIIPSLSINTHCPTESK